MNDFTAAWTRITACAGQEFRTVRGLSFTYRVEGDTVRTSRTDFPLHRNDFQTAHQLMPLRGPGEINDIVRGPSCVFSILSDKRIM